MFHPRRYRQARWFSILLACVVAVILSSLATGLLAPHGWALVGFGLGFAVSAPAFYLVLMRKYHRRERILRRGCPAEWDAILEREVAYYASLPEACRERFRREVLVFLGEKPITGIETEVDERCRLLVAASAIIPVFEFPEWEHDDLSEVLLYPTTFDEDFRFGNPKEVILGMVGVGDTMVLSKPSLIAAFGDPRSGQHVGIHEFAHKIDQLDGRIDGLPEMLLPSRKLARDWSRIMREEKARVDEGGSDLDPYAGKNEAEFFAVVAESFFKDPKRLARRHPDLYRVLMAMFRQDPKGRLKSVVSSLVFARPRKSKRLPPVRAGAARRWGTVAWTGNAEPRTPRRPRANRRCRHEAWSSSQRARRVGHEHPRGPHLGLVGGLGPARFGVDAGFIETLAFEGREFSFRGSRTGRYAGVLRKFYGPPGPMAVT